MHSVASVMSGSCYPVDCSSPGSSVHSDSPGKKTGVGCRALLQGIFPTQGSKPRLLSLLCWQAGSSSLVTSGKPVYEYTTIYLFVLLLVVSELFSDFGYDTKADKNIHLSAFCAPNTHFCWEWNCYVIA